jgi:hypothetical protein
MVNINKDSDKYIELCRKYGEDVQYIISMYGNNVEDIYGDHAKSLLRKERSINIKKNCECIGKVKKVKRPPIARKNAFVKPIKRKVG